MMSSSSWFCSCIAGRRPFRLLPEACWLEAALLAEKPSDRSCAAFDGGSRAELWKGSNDEGDLPLLRNALLTDACTFSVSFASRFFCLERVETPASEQEALLAECAREMMSPMAAG